MGNRIIKESICTSASIDELSWFEEAFFYRLIVNCDDYGRFDARPAVLRSRLFPLKDITTKQVEAVLSKLVTVGMVRVYEYDRQPFLQLENWSKHQSIRNKRSKYPDPNSLECSCTQMYADAPVIQSESKSESKSESESEVCAADADAPPATTKKRLAFTPPTIDEVTAYCRERGNEVDPQRWHDFYVAKGWKIGQNTMKDWQAAVRTWERDSRSGQARAAPPGRGNAGNIFADMARERGLM